MNIISKLFVFSLTLIMLYSCSRNPVTGKREFMLMSESQEKALGAQNDPAVIASFGLYEDQKIQNFINEKGQQMAKISHRPDLDYKFRVLDSPVVNAFAVPGGYIYFTRGILAHFNNEAEFAGVLGHEIGHVTARHSAKQYSNSMLAQVGFMAGVIFSEDFRTFANEASQAMGLLFLKFSRGHESESDRLGVDYSTEVGYDAHEMADFFNTLKRLSGESGGVPTFLSTHPDPADRYRKVHEMAKAKQQEKNLTNLKVNRNEYLAMINGLKYGVDPKQGYTQNNVFYHPDLTFKFPYPSGWRLVNAPTQVQIAPSDGKALIVFTLGQGATLNEVAQKEVQDNQLTVIESSNVKVNGNSAIAMISEQTPKDPNTGEAGQTIRLLSYFIKKGEFIYKFHGLSLKSDFNTYYSKLQSTMKGFSELTDASKINVQAAKIKVVDVKSNQTLKQALLAAGTKQNDLQALSILNGMELGETVKAGSKIKAVSGKIWSE